MTLDPQAERIVELARAAAAEGKTGLMMLPPNEARQAYEETRGPMRPDKPDVALWEDVGIPGPGGEIPMRYYRPAGSAESDALPLYVYLHGGGWYVGNLDTHDTFSRLLANAGGFALLSVDYRLAPEHKFPAAVEDAYAALDWALAGAGGRAVDPARVAIGGDSAGGNISAAVAIMARDAGLNLVHQSLLYPATDFSSDETASRVELGVDYFPSTVEHDRVRSHYLASPEDAKDWRASPLLAPDVAGVAPAFVLTCGYDPLRDEGKAYADKLAAAGVAVVYKCYEGQIHGFLGLGRVIDQAAEAIAEIAAKANAAFGR